MTSRQEGIWLVGLLCVMSFAFQTQLKMLAVQISPILSRPNSALRETLWQVVSEAGLWRPALIIALAGAMFIVWLFALMRLDLSVALPLATIALVVNAIGGGFYLGESLHAMRIAGVLLVAAGISLVLLG